MANGDIFCLLNFSPTSSSPKLLQWRGDEVSNAEQVLYPKAMAPTILVLVHFLLRETSPSRNARVKFPATVPDASDKSRFSFRYPFLRI